MALHLLAAAAGTTAAIAAPRAVALASAVAATAELFHNDILRQVWEHHVRVRAVAERP